MDFNPFIRFYQILEKTIYSKGLKLSLAVHLPFSVGLVDQLFQPASNQVETVERSFCIIMSHGCSSCKNHFQENHVSTENCWKSVLLRNMNRVKQNRLQLKELFLMEHDLSQT